MNFYFYKIYKMDWVTIITALIAALAGGGLTSLVKIRESKKGAQLDNKEKEDNRWSKLCDELQDQIENLNMRLDKKDTRITELEDANASLHIKLDEANTALAKATLLRCTRLGCDKRKPPLGYLELSPEEIMQERNEE